MTKTLVRDFSAPVLELTGKPRKIGWTLENLGFIVNMLLAEYVPAERKDEAEAKINEKIGEPLTLGVAAAIALTETGGHEQQAEPAGQLTKQFSLALRLYGKTNVEITPEERELIKTRVGKFYSRSALVVGRANDLLETEQPAGE